MNEAEQLAGVKQQLELALQRERGGGAHAPLAADVDALDAGFAARHLRAAVKTARVRGAERLASCRDGARALAELRYAAERAREEGAEPQ